MNSEVVQPSELTSVEISKDSKYAIVSHAPKVSHLFPNFFPISQPSQSDHSSSCLLQEILYLELETGSIIRKFEGHDQGQYVLRSCFGGATENFILSGSAGEGLLRPLRRTISLRLTSYLTTCRWQDRRLSSRHRTTALQTLRSRCHDGKRSRLEP